MKFEMFVNEKLKITSEIAKNIFEKLVKNKKKKFLLNKQKRNKNLILIIKIIYIKVLI